MVTTVAAGLLEDPHATSAPKKMDDAMDVALMFSP
jgi:hypothetical protein